VPDSPQTDPPQTDAPQPDAPRPDARQSVTDARRVLFHQVVRDLDQEPRRLPAKLFYDARGAALFEDITRLEEYYPTRTELGILEHCLPEVARRVGPDARVVEFGTGSGEKTALLLGALHRPHQLVLIDISAEQLHDVAEGFRRRHPGLPVVPLAADYTLPYRLPPRVNGTAAGATLFFFPGSTLGNFEPHEARGFLANVAHAGGRGAALLLGVDRQKPREVVEPAYNDAAGVTAEFNRNALHHLNRELGGDFDPEAFEHRAPWNPVAERIEMHLVSTRRQEVRIDPGLPGERPFAFVMDPGEVIVTEHSYKYAPTRLEGLVRSAGWQIEDRWTDDRKWFDVLYLVR